jgi:hypothetical protein
MLKSGLCPFAADEEEEIANVRGTWFFRSLRQQQLRAFHLYAVGIREQHIPHDGIQIAACGDELTKGSSCWSE